MPGSPYIEGKPRGLLMWPTFIKFVLVIIFPVTLIFIYLGLLLEWLIFVTAISFVRFLIKSYNF